MKIFLTGGTGFIGSYVAMELVKHEHRVTILARNPDKVPELKKIEHIEIIEKFIIGKDACILVALNYTKKTGWEVL